MPALERPGWAARDLARGSEKGDENAADGKFSYHPRSDRYQAEARPGCDFLFSSETEQGLTFRQLRDQVRQLSGLQQSLGMAQGDKVAFLMDNGLFTAQLFLATMYGGFVTVPLNVRAGVAQLAYTLETSDAKLVFVGRPYETLLQEVLGQVRRFVEIVPGRCRFRPGHEHACFQRRVAPARRRRCGDADLYVGQHRAAKGPHPHASQRSGARQEFHSGA